MANGWGGARPGAGRKRQETVERQGNRRDATLDVISEQLWRATLKEWIAFARESKQFHLLFPLLPYIMGAAKLDINVAGQVEHVQLESARQVLRVIGGTDERRAG
jgi:hypothetical protein